jgi:hypothetical protein
MRAASAITTPQFHAKLVTRSIAIAIPGAGRRLLFNLRDD